jgi:hypothetical protein
LVRQVQLIPFEPIFQRVLVKIGLIRLTNIFDNWAVFIFHKFVRNFKHVREKLLQIYAKLEKNSVR